MFNYSFAIKLFCSLAFGIFVLALVFEIVFYNPCSITGVTYKESGGWEGVVGWVGKPKVGPPCHKVTDSGAVFSVGDRMYTNHRIDQDGHWQQFGSAPQWPNRPCNAPTQFYRSAKSYL